MQRDNPNQRNKKESPEQDKYDFKDASSSPLPPKLAAPASSAYTRISEIQKGKNVIVARPSSSATLKVAPKSPIQHLTVLHAQDSFTTASDVLGDDANMDNLSQSEVSENVKGKVNSVFDDEPEISDQFSVGDLYKSATGNKTPLHYKLTEKKQLYFDDGLRRIDYVLAYPDDETEEHNRIRATYEENLLRNGLELEVEPKENSSNSSTYFIKLHVPWKVCILYAERLKLKMPLKVPKDEYLEENLSEYEKKQQFCDYCSRLTRLLKGSATAFRLSNHELLSKFTNKNCYTAQFSGDKIEYFDIQDRKTFFSSSERSRIAHRIMSESYFGETKKSIGIDRLLLRNVYSGAYPLHEGGFTRVKPKMSRDENIRRTLYWEWARWGRWYKYQPLALIRYYFGDKIAIYFAWLSFYTTALAIPSFVGLICFLYSIATVWHYPPSMEICDPSFPTYVGNATMCPLCDVECSYWKLYSACLPSQVTYVFDNESTIFFAVFMSLWATLFLEFWKRRQFRLSYEWDLVDYDEERDLIRPEYEAHVTRERLNPVNKTLEPYLNPIARFSRSTFSVVTVTFWVAVVIAAVFAVTVFRLAIHTLFAATVDVGTLGTLGNFASPSVLTTVSASMLSVFIILILNWVYERVALWLTYLELPRTQQEFEDSFALKMFCFQFVNYYSYPLYIAFFKNSFAGYPGSYSYLFGKWRWEQCDVGGCMYELSLQLFLIMFAKQFISNIIELLYPWISGKFKTWLSNRRMGLQARVIYMRWDKDYDLYPLDQLDLFYEYLELVIQYGFVTLFVVAFPLAPLLALLNNILEIRIDAHKFICQYRRPLAQKASDIGVWFYLLEFIGTIAVVTNSLTIAITSETIPKLVYYYTRSVEKFGEPTLLGYTGDGLSIFNVSDFPPRNVPKNPNPFPGETVTECRYHDYRNPPSVEPRYQFTQQYWHTQAARLAFVITMEHVVFFLKKFLDFIIPDRPQKLKDKIKREHYLVQNMLLKAEQEKFRRELEQTMERRHKSFGTPRVIYKTKPGVPTLAKLVEEFPKT